MKSQIRINTNKLPTKSQCQELECNSKFTTQGELKGHLQSKHNIGVVLRKCDKCNSQFPDQHNLNKHRQGIHEATETSKASNPIKIKVVDHKVKNNPTKEDATTKMDKKLDKIESKVRLKTSNIDKVSKLKRADKNDAKHAKNGVEDKNKITRYFVKMPSKHLIKNTAETDKNEAEIAEPRTQQASPPKFCAGAPAPVTCRRTQTRLPVFPSRTALDEVLTISAD